MSTQPLSLPARADNVVEKVNEANGLAQRVTDLESRSGTSVTPTATPGVLKITQED